MIFLRHLNIIDCIVVLCLFNVADSGQPSENGLPPQGPESESQFATPRNKTQ